jgi:hypothetical protein
MPSNYETFWQFERYAVVGHTARRPFPRLTYGGLKANKRAVYAVDPSIEAIDGDATYSDLNRLPGAVDAIVIEVPRDETEMWVQKAVDAGIKDIWLHMKTDTPQALALASKQGASVRHGTCAVMYLNHGFSAHAIHGFIMKMLGKY